VEVANFLSAAKQANNNVIQILLATLR